MHDIIGTTIGIYQVMHICDYKAKDGHKLYHVKCVECGFETDMLKAHIGRAKVCRHKKNISVRQCLHCGKDIPITASDTFSSYELKKFCSCSCAATYNNMQRPSKYNWVDVEISCASQHTNCNTNKQKHKRQRRKDNICLSCGKPCINKYCSVQCQAQYKHRQLINNWLSGDVEIKTNKWGDISESIRKYLFEKYNSTCSRCGWGEVNPYTNKIPLEVEHIDGNYKNNTPDNLTLLCPNCHSLTRAYRGANKGNGRPKTWRPKEETQQND